MNKMRDEAFTDFVVNDNWEKLITYANKYHVIFPKDKKFLEMTVYRLVQSCNNIPRLVKDMANKKYIERIKQ